MSTAHSQLFLKGQQIMALLLIAGPPGHIHFNYVSKVHRQRGGVFGMKGGGRSESPVSVADILRIPQVSHSFPEPAFLPRGSKPFHPGIDPEFCPTAQPCKDLQN